MIYADKDDWEPQKMKARASQTGDMFYRADLSPWSAVRQTGSAVGSAILFRCSAVFGSVYRRGRDTASIQYCSHSCDKKMDFKETKILFRGTIFYLTRISITALTDKGVHYHHPLRRQMLLLFKRAGIQICFLHSDTARKPCAHAACGK